MEKPTRIVALDVGVSTGFVICDLFQGSKDIELGYSAELGADSARKMGRVVADVIILEMPVLDSKNSNATDIAEASEAWLNWARNNKSKVVQIKASDWKSTPALHAPLPPKMRKSPHLMDAFRIVCWYMRYHLNRT